MAIERLPVSALPKVAILLAWPHFIESNNILGLSMLECIDNAFYKGLMTKTSFASLPFRPVTTRRSFNAAAL